MALHEQLSLYLFYTTRCTSAILRSNQLIDLLDLVDKLDSAESSADGLLQAAIYSKIRSLFLECVWL